MSGIIASTSGGLCGGGIGCAAMRTTGPFKSENRFSWIIGNLRGDAADHWSLIEHKGALGLGS